MLFVVYGSFLVGNIVRGLF